MKEINGQYYSRKEFATYEYRVKVKFVLLDDSDNDVSMDLYTSETDKHEIRKAINDTLNRKKCATFSIECFTSREQDELTSKWLEESFNLNSEFDSEIEIEVCVDDISDNIIDKINSLDLRSDLENGNLESCVLRTSGYVGNRPSNFIGDEHEDDTWAIDVLTPEGDPDTAYLYSSKFEYEEDYKLLEKYA